MAVVEVLRRQRGPVEDKRMTDDGTSAEVVVLATYSLASRELERFFGTDPDRGNLSAEMGERGQRYDVGGHGVFDSVMPTESMGSSSGRRWDDGMYSQAAAVGDDFDAEGRSASRNLHLSLMEPKHRRNVQDHTRIFRTLYSLPVEHRSVLRSAFTPRRFSALETLPEDDEKEQTGRWVPERDRGKHKGKGIPHAERHLRIVLSVRRPEARNADRAHIGRDERVPAATLVDLALMSGVATSVHADRLKPSEAPSAHVLLLWMLALADDARRQDIPRQRAADAMSALSTIREKTGQVLMPALKAYDDARRARREREQAEDAARPVRLVEQWQKPTESRRLRRIVDQFGEDGWAAIKEALGSDLTD